MKTPIDRRSFIHTAALSTAALGLSARNLANAQGANGDVRVACVGFRGQGKTHISNFSRAKGARLVALCDVDRSVLDERAKELADQGNLVDTYTDVRRLLERRDIDVISTATPNHWHALITIWACQAGKDVYVEKPVCHNVWEGQQMVKAARKHKRIVQTGTQSRSNPGMREAIQYLHDGNLGKIKIARGLCYKRRKSIGNVSNPTPVPDYIDYDLWCGPAPKEPLMRENLHYDWHWVWDTGNGDLGNQGIHQMDLARWALKADTLSPKVFSLGGRLGYVDNGETANTQIIFHDYPDAPLIFKVRGLGRYAGNDDRPSYRGSSIGVVIDCEHGYMVIPTYHSATAYDHSGRKLKSFDGQANHYENFLSAVRSRKHTDLNADIQEGYLSSSLCHTGNISYLAGAEKSPGAILEAVQGDSIAAESIGRMMEHLEVNDVDLNKTPLTLGEHLKMDVEKERFIDNEPANKLLTRDYREPFVVPETV